MRGAVPATIPGIGLQVILVAGLSDGVKDAALLGRFCVGAVAVISGQVVVDDVADLVKRRGLEENLRLLLEEISGHVDDEGLILHLVVADDLREDVANRRRIVARLFGVVDDPQGDLVAGTQPRQRFDDLALVRGNLRSESPFGDAVLRDLESGVTGRRLSASRANRSQQQGGRAGEAFQDAAESATSRRPSASSDEFLHVVGSVPEGSRPGTESSVPFGGGSSRPNRNSPRNSSRVRAQPLFRHRAA